MLILSRKRKQAVVIDLRKWNLGVVRVTNVENRGDRMRLGVDASREIPVHRAEVFDAIERTEKDEKGEGNQPGGGEEKGGAAA